MQLQPPFLPSGPAMLFVAHPGHELCLHGWITAAHPTVIALTDGSGATGRSRLDSTRDLLRACGCDTAQVGGRFSDREVYRAILDGRTELVAAVVLELAHLLARDRVEYVVADPWEGYNPAHDLCRVMMDLAVQVAEAQSGRSIASYDYPITAKRPNATPALVFLLDDAAFARKMKAAAEYEELRDEVAGMVAAEGLDAFRRESLYTVNGPVRFEQAITPFYEVRGEEQVNRGRYEEVLRFREHFLPFVDSLARAVVAGV